MTRIVSNTKMINLYQSGTLNNYINYDSVGIVINPNDKNYIIYALEGAINYR